MRPKHKELDPDQKAAIRHRVKAARRRASGNHEPDDVRPEEITFMLQVACEELAASHDEEIGDEAKRVASACRTMSDYPRSGKVDPGRKSEETD